MSVWTRCLTAFAVLSALLSGVAYLQPDWATAVGLDWQTVAAAARSCASEGRRGAALERSSIRTRSSTHPRTRPRLARS